MTAQRLPLISAQRPLTRASIWAALPPPSVAASRSSRGTSSRSAPRRARLRSCRCSRARSTLPTRGAWLW